MSNLYSITTNQAAIIALFRAINYNVGNLQPIPACFPTIRLPSSAMLVPIASSSSPATSGRASNPHEAKLYGNMNPTRRACCAP
jgi:hypothetical protein